jgi:hypothetical protein
MLTTMIMYKKVEQPLKTLVCMSGGMFLGFLISDGFWMFTLYEKFQNPMFPYFNNIFKSPMAESSSLIVRDFAHLRPRNVLEFIFYPFKYFYEDKFVWVEHPHVDLKIPAAFVFGVLALVLLKLKKCKKIDVKLKNKDYLKLILIYMVLAYYINLLVFANTRYVIVLFMFIVLVICQVLNIAVRKRRYYYSALGLVFVLFCATYSYSGLQRAQWKKASNFLTISDMKLNDDSTVLLSFLTCFVAPAQNPSVKFIGHSMQKDLVKKVHWNYYYQNKYFSDQHNEEVIKENITSSKDVYFIFSIFELGKDFNLYKESLKRYSGKEIELSSCRVLKYSAYDNKSPFRDLFMCKIK